MNYLNPIIQKIFSFHNFINLIISGQEVVFQCRDEGPLRVNVKWSRGNGAEGLPFPPGTRDFNGRLEIPDIKVSIDWLSSFFILKTFLCKYMNLQLISFPISHVSAETYRDICLPSSWIHQNVSWSN